MAWWPPVAPPAAPGGLPPASMGEWGGCRAGGGVSALDLAMGSGRAGCVRRRRRLEGGKPSTQRHSSGAVRPIAVLFMATRVSPGCRPLLKAGYQQGLGPSVTADPLLGGLLSPDLDDRSCLSRYRASLYRQPSLHNLSSHLVSRLRRYESLHQLCGPGTPAYSRAVARLREAMDGHASSNSTSSDPECSYIIWTPVEGPGNRILSTASAFLYALLTDRVLLVHHPADDLDDIICEPFPGSNTTWVLPENGFPIQGIKGLNVRTRESLGNALGRGEGSRDPPAPWLYVHLQTNYKPDDRRFFCDDGQDTLRGVRWLVLRSDNYFVPGLFFLPRYEEELVPRPGGGAGGRPGARVQVCAHLRRRTLQPDHLVREPREPPARRRERRRYSPEL